MVRPIEGGRNVFQQMAPLRQAPARAREEAAHPDPTDAQRQQDRKADQGRSAEKAAGAETDRAGAERDRQQVETQRRAPRRTPQTQPPGGAVDVVA